MSCKTSSSVARVSSSYQITLDTVLKTESFQTIPQIPHVTKTGLSLLPSTGSIQMQIFAIFGSIDSTSAFKSSISSSEAQIWLADSCLALKLPANSKKTLHLLYTSNENVFGSSNCASFSNSSLSSLNGTSFFSTGSRRTYVYGSFFSNQDNSQKVRIIHSAAEVTMWRSDSAVNLKTNFGSSIFFHLFSHQERNAQNENSNSESIQTLTQKATFSLASGGNLVTIVGMLIGSFCRSLSTKMSQTSCESSNWMSDSSVISKRTEKKNAFLPFENIIVSLVDKKPISDYSNVFGKTWHVTEIKVGVHHSNTMLSTSSQILMIHCFAQSTSMMSSKMKIGSTSCQDTVWTSSSSILCKLHPANAISMDIAVSLGDSNYEWKTKLYRLNNTASLIRPSNEPATGSSIMQIFGKDFSTSDFCDRQRTGYTACERSAWTSSSKVESKIARVKHGAKLSLMLSATKQFVLSQDYALEIDSNNPVFNISEFYVLQNPKTGSFQAFVFGRTVLSIDKTACARIW